MSEKYRIKTEGLRDIKVYKESIIIGNVVLFNESIDTLAEKLRIIMNYSYQDGRNSKTNEIRKVLEL